MALIMEKSTIPSSQDLRITFARLLFVFIVLCLFINIRYPILDSFSDFLGEKKDFTIFFFNVSDILIFCLLISCLFLSNSSRKNYTTWRDSIFYSFLPLSLMVVAFISFFSNFRNLTVPIISLYYLLYITKGIVLHETIKDLKIRLYNLFITIFLGSLSLVSLLAIYQFTTQHDLGLQVLGESIIGPYIWGVAKVEALGQVFLRSYGIFPHPNILGAFLVFGIISATGSALGNAAQGKVKEYLGTIFLINLFIFALFLTFSRAGWLGAGLGLTLYAYFTWNKRRLVGIKRYYLIFTSVFISTLVVASIMLPFIRQRGNVFDKAYQERKSYNSAAHEIIVAHPVLGIGPGESLIHMKQYLGVGFRPWEVQPIHNYYLLLGAEIGLLGLALFILYFGYGFELWWKAIKQSNFAIMTLGIGSIACLILMFFDHYFYTFQSTVLLFWIWSGLFIAEVAHETVPVE